MKEELPKELRWFRMITLIVVLPLIFVSTLLMLYIDIVLTVLPREASGTLSSKHSEFHTSKNGTEEERFYLSYFFEVDGKYYNGKSLFHFLGENSVEVSKDYFDSSSVGDEIKIGYVNNMPEINRPVWERTSAYNFILEAMIFLGFGAGSLAGIREFKDLTTGYQR